MKYRKWEVWFAKVKYEDSDDVKKRPILITGENKGLIMFLKMISQRARDKSDYPLKHWAKVWLDKETVVRTSKICQLIDSDFVWKMGRLSEYDLIRIQNILLQQP